MNKKFTTLIAVSVIVYLISDILFNDAIFYLIGGTLGALSKAIGIESGMLLIWSVILVGITILFYKLQNKPLMYVFIFLIAALLYLLDAILYKIMPDITD